MRSTPFGIKGTFTRCFAYPWDPLDQVLNAFRHQRYFHRTSGASSGRALKVLNAFRHQRYFHHARRLACRPLAGLCSTPFGIKGTFTRWLNSHLRKPTDVLNAFRHQRYFHEYKTVNHVRAERVLNAFRHQRYFHSRQIQATSPVVSCAQRLSASKVLSPVSSFRERKGSCSRAQRLSASKVLSRDMRAAGAGDSTPCSTPFGIKGTFTNIRPSTMFGPNVCSTPFGIKGTFTNIRPSTMFGPNVCSTPFGIKGTFTRYAGC